jgi:hypothetical protein
MQYSIVRNEGTVAVTVIRPGEQPLVAGTGHPNLDAILEGVVKDDESVIALFDLSQTAAEKFERLSERVTVENGRLYFDGDEVDNSVATQVVRFIREGVEDYKPLVKFFENVQQNPNEHSRTQLYDWLDARDFTITNEGHIVGYKGVAVIGTQGAEGGESEPTIFESLRSGRALVNGEVKNGRIPQKVGDVVEMPRSQVAHDPSTACHAGLHVGTFEYASGYNRGALLEVHVNPRDVVSVPTDASGEKVRVCRYTVVGTLDAPYTSAFLDEDDGFDDFEFESVEDMFENQDRVGDEGLDRVDDAQSDPVVPDLDDEPQVNTDAVQVGDTYETTDKRRKGTRFTVESIEGDQAVGKSFHKKKPGTGVTRKVNLDRLTSYRYRKV